MEILGHDKDLKSNMEISYSVPQCYSCWAVIVM